MPDVARDLRVFRIGVFHLAAETGELQKDGKLQLRLQAQPLQVLLTLLDRPREVVTRDELRKKIWSSDTFVDFDHGVNTAINKLRGAFGDSAVNPRFIQTLPRIGYRFVAPVEIIGSKPFHASSASGPLAADAPESHEPANRFLSDAADLPAAPQSVTRILFSAIQVMYLAFYVIALARFGDAQMSIAAFTRHALVASTVLILTAAIGIPLRLYLLSAAAFKYRNLSRNFLRLFPAAFVLDELWALAPFLVTRSIGVALALGATAALLYVPFAERSLLLMKPHAARTENATERATSGKL